MARNFGDPHSGRRSRADHVGGMDHIGQVMTEMDSQRRADAWHRDLVCVAGIIVILAFSGLIVMGIEAWIDWSADQAMHDAVIKLERR